MRRWYAVIAGVVLGIAFGVTQFENMLPTPRGDRNGLCCFSEQARAVAAELGRYRNTHGRFPSNDQGLSPIVDAAKRRLDRAHWTGVRVAPSGMLSWWGDPLIYENRTGRHARDFAWSGAGGEGSSGYSCRVADGVYVWSVGARAASRRTKAAYTRHTVTELLASTASAALLMLYVSSVAQKRRGPSWHRRMLSIVGNTLWGAFLTVAIALLIATFMPVCGCAGPQTARTPELTRDYTATMRAYRDHGAISSAALDRIITNLKSDKNGRGYYRP